MAKKSNLMFRIPSKIKVRNIWMRKPVTKIKPSAKIYNRNKIKKAL
ncbi:MAG: hypothetical protein AABY84_01345 [Candidatus Firestonebacteria bacterium]